MLYFLLYLSATSEGAIAMLTLFSMPFRMPARSAPAHNRRTKTSQPKGTNPYQG